MLYIFTLNEGLSYFDFIMYKMPSCLFFIFYMFDKHSMTFK